MMRHLLISLLCSLLATVAQAQAQEDGPVMFGGDVFGAGQTIAHERADADDLFLAGQRVRVVSDVSGTIHAIGQSVSLRAAADDVYAIGQDVSLTKAITGDASLIGQTILIDGAIGADLRAAGANVEVNAPVTGYALLAGETVQLNAEIGGDVNLAAERVQFGEAARIGGTLTLYEESAGAVQVPETVIPESRITRHETSGGPSDWQPPIPGGKQVAGWFFGRFIVGVIIVSLLAALIAAVMPERLARMRRIVLEAPFRTLGIGFVTESALIGSIVLVAITLVGLLLVPAILLIAAFASLAGYVIAAYAFGVGLLLLIGRFEPDSLAERSIAAGIGALAAALIGLVPVIGWIFVLALSLTGMGAIVQLIFGRDPA